MEKQFAGTYIAAFKLVRVGLRIHQFPLPAVTVVSDQREENVGVRPAPEFVPGHNADLQRLLAERP